MSKQYMSIYRQKREELDLSREEASAVTEIPIDRIEKVENGKVRVYPDDVIMMANGYNAPELCNYYCSKECEIGKLYVPEIKISDLCQITVGMLASMNSMQERMGKMIEISVDNIITEREIEDFVEIKLELEEMAALVNTLQLWSEKMKNSGKIDADAYNRCLDRKKALRSKK